MKPLRADIKSAITICAEGTLARILSSKCLKSAFRIGLIENEEVFLDMLEDRNKTSHIYDKVESEKIFQRIKNTHLLHLEKILSRLKESN
ncbi:MAG: hypothetical protein COS84_07635 [Armatimonadetes bacterium CG07_land_8_20_14_0_80_40_9]|nr:MAG: hypothetical protein COS84_07635 [Armatimonadetes bacterium CG07_land_8_20_14_0_80_40_9]